MPQAISEDWRPLWLSRRKAASAARLNLTLATLSHSLRPLEGKLGVRLGGRTNRTVALTEAGHALEQRAGAAKGAGTEAEDRHLEGGLISDRAAH